MRAVNGVVQHYAWGDPDFIPTLLGVEPDERPWAELWLGTHPNGPTTFDDGTPLVDTTGELSYLLKVLAAGGPLSLQTHPNVDQACEGFERGDYPDPNPKPELLCALTPFEAFCGVRPVAATIDLLDELGASSLARRLEDDGPGAVLDGLYRGSIDAMPAIEACRASTSDRIEARWARRLDAMYPGEASVAASLLLNLVELEPGECVRLDAGNLHGYLSGAGIELMGNSDNVIRGGLTVKHVDIDDLLAVVDPTPLDDPVLPRGDVYELPAANVALRRLSAGSTHTATGHELAVDLAGGTWYLAPGETATFPAETYVVVPL
ncbi:MAG: class I mannose-6-phosphate isomerase [Ilumatobacter sp.]|nr:class I mannose-6-phosphate isomerase [Ilumatobacter sp.]